MVEWEIVGGDLVESLVEGKLIHLLNSRNIKVTRSYTNEKGSYYKDGKKYDYENDIVAKNGSEVVFVEIKTNLKVEDVETFLYKLVHVVKEISDYSDKRIFGAVAFLKASEDSHKFASKKGLFVIKATGDSSWIMNADILNQKIFLFNF